MSPAIFRHYPKLQTSKWEDTIFVVVYSSGNMYELKKILHVGLNFFVTSKHYQNALLSNFEFIGVLFLILQLSFSIFYYWHNNVN